MNDATDEDEPNRRNVDPNQLLYAIMFPAIIMPLTGWMFGVSLPIIRDDLMVDPDVASWIATAFTLPFMILMPVYGRVSDGLGKRRLLIIGITVFTIGLLIATFSTNLAQLIIGRAVQGFGIAGMIPLSLALITEVFPPEERGKALGWWSTVGPVTGVVGPILAGFIVANWGWRSSFLPPILFAVLSIGVIYVMIPSSGRKIDLGFLRRFDWGGVGFLFAGMTFLLFYLSSRPITGVAPLRDWRLGLLTIGCFGLFVFYERRRKDPFIRLNILNNRALVFASIGACLRMIGLSGGFGFLMPLYLADVLNLDTRLSGFFLMVNPAAMAFVVRIAGGLADRWGSQRIVMTGFSIQVIVFLLLTQLTTETPYAIVLVVITFFGVGVGLMLATLHRAALNNLNEKDIGTASGLYSMIRFLGSALGAAIGGILLKLYLDQFGSDVLSAYQATYLWFAGFALIGILIAYFLPSSAEAPVPGQTAVTSRR